MTLVNVLTGGVASADSVYSTYTADKACDSNTVTLWNSTNTDFPHWWQYEFPQPHVISCIRIYPYMDANGACVKNFVFAGSNNGVDWTPILSNIINKDYNDWQYYAMYNITPYLFYRFTFADNYRSDKYIVVREIIMYEDDGINKYLLGRSKERIQTAPVSFRMEYMTQHALALLTKGTMTLTADSEYSVAFPASAAADGNYSSYWNSANVAFPHWWKAQLPAQQIVVAINIYPFADGGGAYCKDFTFEGSNDDTNWTTLTTGQFPNRIYYTEWAVINSCAFLYYRVTFTNTWHSGNYCVIREIDLFIETAPHNYLKKLRSRVDLSPISTG